MPDLAALAASSGFSKRKLRYVLDQGLLPGAPRASHGRGAPRLFTPLEGFGILVAAAMLHAGLKRRLVRETLLWLCRPAFSPRIQQAFLARTPCALELGDWKYVRLIGTPETPWLPLGPGRPAPEGFRPLVTVTFALEQLKVTE